MAVNSQDVPLQRAQSQQCLHPAAGNLNFTAGSPKESSHPHLWPHERDPGSPGLEVVVSSVFVPVFSVTPGLHPAPSLPVPDHSSWGRTVTSAPAQGKADHPPALLLPEPALPDPSFYPKSLFLSGNHCNSSSKD